MNPLEVVKKFDQYLYKHNMSFEAVVIGGAAKLFASIEKVAETSLKENWLSHGPESLRNYLRSNWRLRLQPLFKGRAITFTTLGRIDLVGTKILAFCDRGTDFKDCIDLKPTRDEILEILPWVEQYDLNPDWPKYVRSQVDELAKRLGYVL